jgi:hypothetical protein
MGYREKIKVVVGGVDYSDWEKVDLSLSAETINCTIWSNRTPAPLFFVPETSVQIYANGALLLDGDVVRYEAKYSAVGHIIQVHVAGKDVRRDHPDVRLTQPTVLPPI